MAFPAPRTHLLLPALAIGQIFGWGTTYYLPSVLAPALTRDLGFDATEIYLGVTIMVAIGGLASPIAGRLFDRLGAARFLPVGPLTIGLGQWLFAARPSIATWYGAWALFGIAMAFGLTLAVNTFLTRFVGAAARRQIGLLALMVGFAPSVFWPLTALIEAHFGWRETLVIYGAIEICLLLPAQLWLAAHWTDRVAPGSVDESREETTGDDEPAAPRPLTPRLRTIAIVAMVAAFTLQGFASWGLPLHIITLFEALGLDHTSAVEVAAASGAAAIAARMIEVLLGQRIHPITTTGLSIAVLAPMLALLGSPLDPLVSAWIFILVWSGANGILAVLRVTLPLYLFGAAAYGSLMGRMSLPQNLAFAAAPAIFAVVIGRMGPQAALWLAIAASLVALVAAAVLARIAHPRPKSERKPTVDVRRPAREWSEGDLAADGPCRV